ncbi:hypothetical protein LR013_01645 [candidate division NPL-UPA2 bacterium]|nr:hypothetical protein [candidate division NPL-UPA2 bacterium]
MASFALLPALAGFQFDMVNKHIGFAPLIQPRQFGCFWSLEGAWGTYKRSDKKIWLKVEAGKLKLRSFSDSMLANAQKIKTNRGESEKRDKTLYFRKPITIKAGQTLKIETTYQKRLFYAEI